MHFAWDELQIRKAQNTLMSCGRAIGKNRPHAVTSTGSVNSSKYFVSELAGSESESLLTGHLSSLEVPEMLHCHLQDVCLLQFGVSGALRRNKEENGQRKMVRIALDRRLTRHRRWRTFGMGRRAKPGRAADLHLF